MKTNGSWVAVKWFQAYEICEKLFSFVGPTWFVWKKTGQFVEVGFDYKKTFSSSFVVKSVLMFQFEGQMINWVIHVRNYSTKVLSVLFQSTLCFCLYWLTALILCLCFFSLLFYYGILWYGQFWTKFLLDWYLIGWDLLVLDLLSCNPEMTLSIFPTVNVIFNKNEKAQLTSKPPK